ncbi:MAG: hypothetical protein E6Z28_01640 [Actinomyces urogenitalis]|uniref:hypothetical protein n=1 Tax=Actinomyces urogenitalis TaxID=103621 RepID=UPI0012E07DC9|nr:hypothetical protein [Actinomyces urogenitalis]MDU5873727.1 hypothetical protein [Actinomyces urogenitalis]
MTTAEVQGQRLEADPAPGVTPLPDDTAARAMSWSLPAGGQVRAVLFGGGFRVDLHDLDTLAAQLSGGAGLLDEAARHLGAAHAQIEAGSHPFAYELTPWDLAADPMAAEWQRAQAIQAVDALRTGPGSVAQVAELLQTLSTDVLASAEAYQNAEARNATSWQTSVQILHNVSLVQALGGGTSLALSLARLLAASPRLRELMDDTVFHGLQDLVNEAPEGTVKDGLADLLIVLSDADLAQWVRTDLLAILVLGVQAVRAGTSQEAARLEAYLSQAADRLDPVISARLPRDLAVGSQIVPAASLTPMQRVTAYLAMRSAEAGRRRFGERTGLRLTPHGGSPFTVPAALRDPLGLGTAVAPLAVAWSGSEGRCLSPLATPSDVMRYSDGLKQSDSDQTTGVISLVRTDHVDGTRSWLVVVPGTTNWGMGGPNPQDMLTNLEAVARMPTDMESAVVSAMRAAGVAPEDPVALYGHSQGAITASNLAADPAVAQRFTVTTLLTVGGPVAGAAVPETVRTLHVENGADAVPALDARTNPVGPARLTLRIDTTGTNLEGYPHGSLVYAQALEGMPADPALEDWARQLRGITGAGEEGAVTSEVVFDVERLTDQEQPGAAVGR